jgi:hypothetical protein
VRFSFNPRHWVWSLDEYAAAPMSIRGRWAVETPDVTSVDPRLEGSPWPGAPRLEPIERRPLGLALDGAPTGLDYDAAGDRFLLTTAHGIYLADGALRRVERYTVVDPLFSVELGRFAAAAFLPGGRLIAVTENKSFVIVRPGETGDAGRNFRYFLESPAAFDELTRSRFTTVRARLMYVMSAAVDPSDGSIVTVSVPNARSRRWFVTRFDGSDMQISEEFAPRLAADLAGRASDSAAALERCYVTGSAIADGRLYAVSAAHATLLTIDLAARAVIAAHAIPGLARPTGLALQGDRLLVVDADGGLTIVPRPAL